MDNIIHKVGAAIEAALRDNGCQDEIDAPALARAAIEAMREPTEAMTLAPPDVNFSPGDAEHCWKCMIDAALTPETNKMPSGNA